MKRLLLDQNAIKIDELLPITVVFQNYIHYFVMHAIYAVLESEMIVLSWDE